MASCKIEYIENLPTATNQEKSRLTDLHISIARELYSHRVENKAGYINKVFHFTGTKLVVLGRDQSFKDAQNLVNIINRDKGFEAVKLIEDPQNNRRHYASIDVSLNAGEEQSIDNIDDMHQFFKNYFGDSAIITNPEEFEDAIDGHEEVFKSLTDQIISKAQTYLEGLKQSGDYYKKGATEKDLRILISSLKDKSTYGLIEGVSKYIVQSSNNMRRIKNRLNIIENRLADLAPSGNVRENQLKEISDFVRHSSYYYHLFDRLEDLAREFTTLGANKQAINNYERDLLEQDLRKWMEELKLFSEDDIVNFLNIVPSEINDSGRLFDNFKERYKDKMNGVTLTSDQVDKLEDQMRDILNRNMKSEGSNQQKLDNLISELRPFKSRLKDLHYEVLTEVYYPGFAASFDAGKMSIDGKTPLEEKWKLSKKDFKTILSVGEEDIDSVTMWGTAMINVKETLPMTVANYFKEVMLKIDMENKKDITELQDFLVRNGRKQGDDVLQALDSASVIDNYVIEAIEEVDDDFVPTPNQGIITVKSLGVEKKYKARKIKAFLNQYNTAAFSNEKKAFQHVIDEVAAGYASQLLTDNYALVNFKDSTDPILNYVYNLMYSDKSGDDLLTNSFGKFLNSDPSEEEIKSRMIGMLWSGFNSTNISIKDTDEIESLMKSQNVIDSNGNFVDLNLDSNYVARQFVLKNSYFHPFKENSRGSNLQDKFYFSPESLFGKKDGNVNKVLVEYTDNTYGYVELLTTPLGIILSNTSGKDIAQYATFSKEFSKLNDKYNIEYGGFGAVGKNNWDVVQHPGFNKEYFDRITGLYQAGRMNYGMDNLMHQEIPQVKRLEESTKMQQIKEKMKEVKDKGVVDSMMEYASSYQVEEKKMPLMRYGVYINEEGEPVNDPVYVSREAQYVNGQKIRYVSAKYTRPIDVADLETDLYKSVLLYKTASNTYRGLKNNESQALLLQTILEGDRTLGIDPRKVKVREYGKTINTPGGGIKMKDHEVKTSKLITSFLNSYIYGIESEDYGILGSKISAKKVAKMISGYTAYNALAWNISTIPSNRLISVANTRIVAEGNQWFNQTHWNEARSEYRKNIGKFMNDLKSETFITQKSYLTQLISRFNAIQGDFLDHHGIIQTQKIGDKMASSYLFWTSEMVEHMNQTESMIMIMKGFNIEKPDGTEISLWDAFKEANEDRKDGEALQKPEYFSADKEIEFQKRLQGVNRQIHGNYQSLDKNMMQKSVFTNMIMMFKKYIYDGFRSRFMSERYDQELRDEQEGYFRTYMNGLNKEFAEVAKTQGFIAALKSEGLKSIGTTVLKTSLAGWDAATFRKFSKGNKKISDYLYGEDLSERQMYAAMKATYEIGFAIRAMIMALVAEAILSGLDDDDEEIAFVMRYVDVYARRLENDLGFFTSFTNFGTGSYAGATLDQTIKTIKNPLAAIRTFDNTAGLFKQLIDVDFRDGEGNWDVSWGALDKYEKSGPGYEKGDYKISRKAEKSLLSPYYQVIKLADPETMQQYLSLTQKYQNN